MREIEVLAELHDDIKTALKQMETCEYVGDKHTVDTYYIDPKRKNLKLNAKNKLMECCRIREKGNKFYVTYKIDKYEGPKWLYSEEYETEVKDLHAMEMIFDCLGLEVLVVVDNIKHTFETEDYEIVIEEVKGLGNFIEVEAKNDDERFSVDEVKAKIYQFIDDLELNVGDELNSGKPELLLCKKQQSSENEK